MAITVTVTVTVIVIVIMTRETVGMALMMARPDLEYTYS
jgi:hypothetical protein